MKKIIIFGDSAFAEIAYEYFTHDSDYTVEAFCVEKAYLKKGSLFSLPVLEFEEIEKKYNPKDYSMFVALVYNQLNKVRERIFFEAKRKGYELVSYISSRAFVWRNVKIGENCFIFEDNTIQPFVKIGDNNIFWSGNHIGHHSIIGNHNFISSHVVISGFCEIGNNNFFGVNCTFANNLKIGNYNWFSPNVLILKNVEDNNLFKGEQSKPAAVSSLDFFKIKDA